jgi:hypothetical protein
MNVARSMKSFIKSVLAFAYLLTFCVSSHAQLYNPTPVDYVECFDLVQHNRDSIYVDCFPSGADLVDSYEDINTLTGWDKYVGANLGTIICEKTYDFELLAYRVSCLPTPGSRALCFNSEVFDQSNQYIRPDLFVFLDWDFLLGARRSFCRMPGVNMLLGREWIDLGLQLVTAANRAEIGLEIRLDPADPTTPLQITSIRFLGANSPFSIINNDCLRPITVPTPCVLQVRFEPNSQGDF